ncbi:hypothetical protein TEA_026305 [Camellia sinensis var. sinensis]|uniref:Uncharacterized protein n=1 Tax=Camellia sinensis var. sinensis TaxID=542762 RepID=A0A4S4DCE0_CAMSN|nr:hypothetical protein TEA_026305 [Camellia sinensis var. sinensis]
MQTFQVGWMGLRNSMAQGSFLEGKVVETGSPATVNTTGAKSKAFPQTAPTDDTVCSSEWIGQLFWTPPAELCTGFQVMGLGKAAWPELLGAEGKIAAATIERENPLVKAVIVPIEAIVIDDFVCYRVRVLVDKSGIVVKVPVAERFRFRISTASTVYTGSISLILISSESLISISISISKLHRHHHLHQRDPRAPDIANDAFQNLSAHVQACVPDVLKVALHCLDNLTDSDGSLRALRTKGCNKPTNLNFPSLGMNGGLYLFICKSPLQMMAMKQFQSGTHLVPVGLGDDDQCMEDDFISERLMDLSPNRNFSIHTDKEDGTPLGVDQTEPILHRGHNMCALLSGPLFTPTVVECNHKKLTLLVEEFSPDGRFIISADRDFKIRVTLFPKKTLDGAHEIQSFCLGHSKKFPDIRFSIIEHAFVPKLPNGPQSC